MEKNPPIHDTVNTDITNFLKVTLGIIMISLSLLYLLDEGNELSLVSYVLWFCILMIFVLMRLGTFRILMFDVNNNALHYNHKETDEQIFEVCLYLVYYNLIILNCLVNSF